MRTAKWIGTPKWFNTCNTIVNLLTLSLRFRILKFIFFGNITMSKYLVQQL